MYVHFKELEMKHEVPFFLQFFHFNEYDVLSILMKSLCKIVDLGLDHYLLAFFRNFPYNVGEIVIKLFLLPPF